MERFADYLDRFACLDHFQKVFCLGLVGRDEIEYREGGELRVTSGELLACDPYYCDCSPAFEQIVPPGRYLVALAVLHTGNDDQRVALAGLRVRDSWPVRWEVARRTGEEDGEDHGYGVDSGTGSFLDVDAVAWLLRPWRRPPTTS